MTGKQILDAIHARNTYFAFANAFRQNDLDVIGQGWIGTRSKLELLLDNQATAEVTQQTLEQIYSENLLYTHKALILWSIDREVAKKLADSLELFVDPESPYLATFPLPLPADQLGAAVPNAVPTAVIDCSGGRRTLVLASKRTITEEEVLSPESIPESLRSEGYMELVGKKSRVFPVFDSITVTPDRGLIELRIDLAKNASERDIFKYREALRSRFNDQAFEILGVENLLGDALNLVDALNPLYKGNGWVVQRIGHVNEGGYINSNRGRHRIDDVRTDQYHKNGEAAVDHLQLWSLSAVFKSPQGHGLPMLVLEGHSSMLSAEHPFMDLARVLDCASEEDYQLVLSTLLNCLTPTVTSEVQEAVVPEVEKQE